MNFFRFCRYPVSGNEDRRKSLPIAALTAMRPYRRGVEAPRIDDTDETEYSLSLK